MKSYLKLKTGWHFHGISDRDAHTDFDGKSKTAASPVDHLLMSVGACAGIEMLNILDKMHIQVMDMDIEMGAERAEDFPKRFTSISLLLKLKGENLPADKVQKALDMTFDKYCSVSQSLREDITIDAKFEIEEC